MKYIFISYDAIIEFTTGRFFQNTEYNAGENLCKILSEGTTVDLHYPRIKVSKGDRGLFFYTQNIDKKRGVIFDLQTFSGFQECSNDRLLMLFQRVLKYAIRYFDGQKRVKCEHELPGTNTTLVYPFPFAPNKDVEKVFIDRNSFKEDRKGNDYLTVYYYGKESSSNFVATNARKAVADLESLKIEMETSENDAESFMTVTELEPLDLPIDERIGFDHWQEYLTKTQGEFIKSELKGPERLEGAAGTGKTVSMILRCVNILKEKVAENKEYHLIFITHSLATKERILDVFRNVWPEADEHLEINQEKPYVSVCVTTLQEWSGAHIGAGSVTPDQYLDKDAAESKMLQKLYIIEAFENLYAKVKPSLKTIFSKDFISFLEETNEENLYDLLQQEIAIIIKGRASQNLEKYKQLTRPKYAMPLTKDTDKEFIFRIHEQYQESLIKIKKFDSDDIILTALKNLDTPIWKRFRMTDGYDGCFVDETQLFNINELSIFQYINKENVANHIIYAIDKSQAVGDWGIDNELIEQTFGVKSEKDYKFNVVFRNSPEIVDLAFCILSDGATLFTNFENPLDHYTISFTREQEKKCTSPLYQLLTDDDEMISKAFSLANDYCRDSSCKRSGILIATTTDELFNKTIKYAHDYNKPFEKLKSRSDINSVKKATLGNKFVIGGIDNIGGLEFDALILIGVDKDRVPPAKNDGAEAYHFLDYAWHNRMYVAITRAKYSVTILGNRSRGVSSLMEMSINSKLIDYLE